VRTAAARQRHVLDSRRCRRSRRARAPAAEDPVGAAAEHRRRRLHARTGFAVGALLGSATILLAWLR
jgi:hypothetical protein